MSLQSAQSHSAPMAATMATNMQIQNIPQRTSFAQPKTGASSSPLVNRGAQFELKKKVSGKSIEISDECFTLDFSDERHLTLSKWNGKGYQDICAPISPACFVLTSATEIIVGKDAITKFADKVQYPLRLAHESIFGDEVIWRKNVTDVASFLKHILDLYKPATAAPKTSAKNSKSKQKSKSQRLVTFAVSQSITLKERQFFYDVAKAANVTLANIFTEDVSMIATTYFRGGRPFFGSTTDCVALVLSERINILHMSLIRVEIDTKTKGIDRLVTAASVSMPGSLTSDISGPLAALCTSANILQSDIKGVVYSNGLKMVEPHVQPFLCQEFVHLSGWAVCYSPAEYVAHGACLLSAAELDSSKEYIKNEEGAWTIVYQLPVGDSCLQFEVGMRLEHAPTSTTPATISATTVVVSRSEVQVLFGPSKVSKMDHGVLRPTKGVSLECTRQLKRQPGPGEKDPYVPRLTLLCRKTGDEAWELLQEYYPLSTLVDGCDDKRQCTMSCNLKVRLDPHIGLPVIDIKHGQSETEVRKIRTYWFQVLAFILAVLMIPAAYIGYSYFSIYAIRRSQETWLRNFYAKHSPEKLKSDAQLVSRTVEKYKDKMFVLWRTLEKAYKKKIDPPPYVVEPDL